MSDKSRAVGIEVDMAGRIARYENLIPLEIQRAEDIPQEALDIIYSRRLLAVVGLGEGMATALASAAPIQGAGGITITLATCPPGQGPDLHGHKATYETFTVLQGAFEFRWGETGGSCARLDRLDTISVPPGVYRAFRNISQQEGILQVIISGGVHDAGDVVIPPQVTAALRQASEKLYEKMEASGITFVQD